ncbi:MAG: thioredoxin [Ruaniaceae bacterium]|nr:thioredoxin [Ruaniaceae bacterium]
MVVKPTVVTDDSFKAEVLDSEIPVLVDFWATWCPPCRQMAPVINDLAIELDGTVKIAKMDTDENQTVPRLYGISSIPTFNLYKGGELVASFVGGRPKRTLRDEIRKALSEGQ